MGEQAKIIVIFGSSGSGKTTLIEQMVNLGGLRYSVHVKDTDRPPRKYDDIEINSINHLDPTLYDYVYQTYGYKYGIKKDQIDQALAKSQNHFIICNDISTIKSIKRDYSNRVYTIYHNLDASEESILKVQKDRGISDDEIQLRVGKIEILKKQFIENNSLFDSVLTNRFDKSIKSLSQELEEIISSFAQRHSDSSSTEEVLKFLEENRLLKAPAFPFQKGYSFIMMPIREDDHGNEDVHQAIIRACRKHKVKAERVDNIQFTGQITEKILGSIAMSEFVVADISDERPNVYYEVGYADALNKPIILLAKHGTDLHFDLQGMNVLFYKGITHLESELSKAIEGIRENTSSLRE